MRPGFFLLLFPLPLICQTVKPCPCQNVQLLLAPDSTVVHKNLKELRINTSYLLWSNFLALGNAGYPSDDVVEDAPENYHTYCFGCADRNVVYSKTDQKPFTGEIIFTGDNDTYKDLLFNKVQLVNGLKDGYEIDYSFDATQACSYPNTIIFYKAGRIYKKVYTFSYDNGKLWKESDESFSEGRAFGKVKLYDNSLVVLENDKMYYNREKLVYEAQVLKLPSRECCNSGRDFGYGSHTSYPVYDTSIAFDGHKIDYEPETGAITNDEFWQNERLQSSIDYYTRNTDCPQKKGLIREKKKYTYSPNGDFLEECVRYFSDCKSSLQEQYQSKSFVSRIGSYVLYEAPGQLKIKGTYDDNGQKEGVWETYSQTGKIEERSTYHANLKQGIEEVFDDKGLLFRKLRYEQDKVVEIMH